MVGDLQDEGGGGSSPPSSSVMTRSTVVPACTTALVTSSLVTVTASSASRSLNPTAAGTPSPVHSASAARTNRRAADGASGIPGRLVRLAGRRPGTHPAREVPGRCTVSRCRGRGATVRLLRSDDTDRVTDGRHA
ncbi:hypothetical protein SCALM49S_01025 [Streptomyces californicus]